MNHSQKNIYTFDCGFRPKRFTLIKFDSGSTPYYMFFYDEELWGSAIGLRYIGGNGSGGGYVNLTSGVSSSVGTITITDTGFTYTTVNANNNGSYSWIAVDY